MLRNPRAGSARNPFERSSRARPRLPQEKISRTKDEHENEEELAAPGMFRPTGVWWLVRSRDCSCPFCHNFLISCPIPERMKSSANVFVAMLRSGRRLVDKFLPPREWTVPVILTAGTFCGLGDCDSAHFKRGFVSIRRPARVPELPHHGAAIRHLAARQPCARRDV